MLLPLHVACAGGKPQLNDDCDQVEEKESDDDSNGEDNEDESHTKRKKCVVRYSEYAFLSKMHKLIEELKRVRDEDNTDKSLVFSQFGSTLKWLQEELPKHGFQFRTLSGDMPMRQQAKALHDFQYNPPTTIFLLSMRAGAVGINLTQANRVFLMEPSINPAVELQCVGRVHRLGQQRTVEIVRLVVKDSVESRMVAMLDKKYGVRGENINDEKEDENEHASLKNLERFPAPLRWLAV